MTIESSMFLPEPFILYFLIPEKRVQCLSYLIEAYNAILYVAPLQGNASGQYIASMDAIRLVESEDYCYFLGLSVQFPNCQYLVQNSNGTAQMELRLVLSEPGLYGTF